MKNLVTVREYARLTTEEIPSQDLDHARIAPSAFDWLCRWNASFGAGGAALVEVEDRRWLKLGNHVGVIETPCGTRLEILPKHTDDGDAAPRSRRLLRRMICASMNLPVREAYEASLQLFDAPLNEWVIARLLLRLDRLVKRGLRSDYVRVEATEPFLRGRLDIVRRMRQPPGRQHVFPIRHDVFTSDRPENRLLKLALDTAARATQAPASWRLAQELRGLMHGIPASDDVPADFRRWRNDRLMAHYLPVRPWCELVLQQQMPHALLGDWRGVSLLYPMEKLFERYVGAWLRGALASDATLTAPAASQYLCVHEGADMFRLEPDLLVRHGSGTWVLDTKWKRTSDDRSRNYGVAQADMYQLFAYGQRYLAGRGDLFLVFPKTQALRAPLPAFDFGSGLRLRVVPFDLDAGHIEAAYLPGLPLRASTQAHAA